MASKVAILLSELEFMPRLSRKKIDNCIGGTGLGEDICSRENKFTSYPAWIRVNCIFVYLCTIKDNI